MKFASALATLLICLTLVISGSGWAWASEPVFQLSENPLLHHLTDQPLPEPSVKTVQPWYWLLSIVPGLGQLVMGDIFDGLFFMTTIFMLAVAMPYFLTHVFGTIFLLTEAAARFPEPPTGIDFLINFLNATLWVMAGMTYLWNLVHAYVMNQEELEKISQQIQDISDRWMIGYARDTVWLQYRTAF